MLDKRKGIITINKTDLVFFCISAIMIMPTYFTNNAIMKLLGNACAVFVFYTLFIRYYKPSKFAYTIAAYYIYIVINTFLNKSGDIHSIISSAKVVFMVGFIDYMFAKRMHKAVDILFYIIFIYVLIDFFSVMLFPDGLYKIKIEWNQWSSSDFAQWIFGNKNNHEFWFITLLMLAYIRYYLLDTKIRKYLLILIAAINIITPLVLHSSTSLTVSVIAVSGIYLSHVKSKIKIRIEPYIVLAVYAVVTMLIVLGSVSFLAPVVKGLFSKDLTFSNRTSAWETVLTLIPQKPIFGFGDLSNADAISTLGSKAFVNSHNQWLEIFWQGGLVLFLITVFLINIVIRKLKKCLNIDFVNTLIIILTAYFIEMIFEVGLGNVVAWCPLLFCYYAVNLEKAAMEKSEIKKTDMAKAPVDKLTTD